MARAAPPVVYIGVRKERAMRMLWSASWLLCGLWPAVAPAAPHQCPALTRIGVSDLGLTSYRDGERVAGLGVDVVREVARRAGCKIELRWYPRQRLFAELEAGHIDMTLGAVRVPERDVYASHVPYAYLQYDLLLAPRDGQQYSSLSDFVQRGSGRLNLTRGIKYDAAIEAQLELLTAAGRVELVNDFDTVFTKIALGRAEGTLATAPIYTGFLRQQRYSQLVRVIPLPESAPRFTGLYISRQTISAAARANYVAAVKSMVQDQTVQALYARYFDEPVLKRLFQPGPAALIGALNAAEP